MKYFNLKIPEDQHREIKIKALEAGKSMNQYILDCLPLNDQIDSLAKHIMKNVDGEPSQNEGAVECAIRLLGGETPTEEYCKICGRLEGYMGHACIEEKPEAWSKKPQKEKDRLLTEMQLDHNAYLKKIYSEEKPIRIGFAKEKPVVSIEESRLGESAGELAARMVDSTLTKKKCKGCKVKTSNFVIRNWNKKGKQKIYVCDKHIKTI